jgi:hypothetical protein
MFSIMSHWRNANQNHSEYHFTPIRMAIIKQKRQITNVGEGVEKLEPFYIAEEWKMVRPLLKTIWQFFRRINIQLTYEPAILLLCI